MVEEESPDEDEDVDRPTSVVPSDPLQRYLSEIRRYRILSREEEKEVALQYT